MKWRMQSEHSAEKHPPDPKSIIDFWQNAGPAAWFEKVGAFDEEIKLQFHDLPDAAATGAFSNWMQTSDGSLALILILDQFPRNLYRGSAKAFSYDDRARAIARNAIKLGHDDEFEIPLKRFFYLPFMHSEKLADQQYCIELCAAADDQDGVEFGYLHAEIIKKFSRFPHRNEVLNRTSTAKEIEFLSNGGFQG